MNPKLIIRFTKCKKGGQAQFRWVPMQVVLTYTGLNKLLATQIINEYFKFVNHLIENHGCDTCVKVLKGLYTLVTHYSLGFRPSSNATCFVGDLLFQRNKVTGLPRRLKYINKAIQACPRAVVTLTAVVRMMVLKPSFDISTVTNEYSGMSLDTGVMQDYISSFKSYLDKADIRLSIDFASTWHTSMASGPNGRVAMLTCFKDLVSLKGWVHYPTFMNLLSLCNYVQLSEYIEKFILSTYEDIISLQKSSSKLNLARLAFISDKAGKTRIVYILNYFLQEALWPLHNTIMEWLKRQPQDGTYNQRSAVDKVILMTKDKINTWSFDLTAATDRWPVWHQRLVLTAAVGPTLTALWELIMGINPFSPPHNKEVSYATGQPMGAYSSWATFAFTHHLVLRHLCWLCGVSKSSYVILGDDLTIFNEKVALEYKKLITRLGVTISETKSVVPGMLKPDIYSAEFAKKLIRNGDDLSPMSPLLLHQIYNLHQWWKVLDLFREYCGYDTPVVKYVDSTILIHPLINALMSFMNGKEKHQLRIVLGSGFSQITPLGDYDIVHKTWVLLDNPWGFNPLEDTIDALGPKLKLGSHILKQLEVTYQKLHRVKEYVASGEGSESRTIKVDHMDNQYHPINACLGRLQHDIDKVIRSIDQGQSYTSNDALVSIEADFLLEVVIDQLDYKTYLSRKDRRNRYIANLIVKIYNDIQVERELQNRKPDTQNWVDDCSGW